MNNVLLINPVSSRIYSKNFSFFPIGIASLASVLKSRGFNVKIIDFQSNPENLKDNDFLRKEINSFAPDIVGIGCLFLFYYPNLKEIAKKIKEINPHLLIAVGGLHPTIFHHKILSDIQYIDFVIIGEAEYSFLSLCLKLINKDYNLKDIDGLAYRSGGEIITNPKKLYIDNLDDLPFPYYDGFDLDKYFNHIRYSKRKKNYGMSIITSRSCSNKCTFCSMFHTHGPRWRPRSPENVLDELEFLYNKHQVRHFMFMDDNMTYNKSRTMAIFSGILKRGMKVTFNFPNGVSIKTIDREIVDILKEAGCVEISLPIESGSEYIRNEIIRKKLSNDKIFEVIEFCNEYNIETIGFFVLGMPGENKKTMEENIGFVKQLRGNRAIDFLSVFFATPFPGTVLFEQCLQEKLIDERTIQELLDGTVHVFDKPVIKLKTFSEQEMIKYRSTLLKIFIKQNFLRLSSKFITSSPMMFRIMKSLLKRFL